jgi:photosystem II stability/assembly factor-like uncharacterized protein
VEDLSLRAEFHRALDPVAPPAPWLSAAAIDGLRRKQRDGTPVVRTTSTRFAVAGLFMVLIAAAIATALILSQVFAPVPVHNPPPQPGSATIPIASAPQFITPDDGLVLTGKGLLLTRNGGKSWQLVLPVDWSHFSDVRFLDTNHIVVLTGELYPDTLHATADGGATWRTTRIASIPEGQGSIFFLDDHEGWQVFGGIAGSKLKGPANLVVIYHTVDSGAHWTQLIPVQLTNSSDHGVVLGEAPFGNLLFSDSTHGFMSAGTVSGVARLYVSNDAGRNWQLLELPAPPGGFPNDNLASPTVPTMFGQQGVLIQYVTRGSGPAGQLDTFTSTTNDAGLTWNAPRPTPMPCCAPVAFLDATHWWQAGGSVVYRTSDAGVTWTKSSSQALPALSFETITAVSYQVLWGTAGGAFSATEGCAPRFDGCLYPIRSTDSGAHWTIVKLPPT